MSVVRLAPSVWEFVSVQTGDDSMELDLAAMTEPGHPFSTGDNKQRLIENGCTFNDSNVRSSLKRLADSKLLETSGKSKTLRYSSLARA